MPGLGTRVSFVCASLCSSWYALSTTPRFACAANSGQRRDRGCLGVVDRRIQSPSSHLAQWGNGLLWITWQSKEPICKQNFLKLSEIIVSVLSQEGQRNISSFFQETASNVLSPVPVGCALGMVAADMSTPVHCPRLLKAAFQCPV